MPTSMAMPAGKYWIGDPCYIFPNDGPLSDKWMELLEKVDFFEVSYGELDDGKIKVWAASTAYGDGLYSGTNGFEVIDFSVDAGLIGIVPQETVDYLGRGDRNLETLGLFVEFTTPFRVECLNGVFRFGYIYIDTNDEEIEYDEDD